MSRTWGLTLLLVTLLSANAAAQDARAVIAAATQAMGAAGLNSITYSGTAATANFGQSRTISFGLASTSLRNYTRTIDFVQAATRVTALAAPPAVQGGPSPGLFEETAQASDSWTKSLDVWITPWGFLRGAAANAAIVRSQRIDGVAYQVVTWSPPRKAPSGQSYRLVGYISAENLVERVDTWCEHPVLGDLHIETTYSNYFDAAGTKVPGRISQKRVGMEVFVAVIANARSNPPDLATLLTPSSPAGASTNVTPSAPIAAPAAEKLADGVYRLGGDYTALVVELRDYVVVIGGGGDEARGLAILADTRRLVPNKPVRYVVNTHPHFDHAAVLAPFAAQGITILTDDPNRYFLEQALGSPRTLVGDALGKSRRKPKVESVVEKHVLRDNTRSLELHHLERFDHSDGTLVAYLPKEKILFTADVDAPAAGGPASPALAALVQNLERLQIEFDRHVTVRPSALDRPMTRADLAALVQPSK